LTLGFVWKVIEMPLFNASIQNASCVVEFIFQEYGTECIINIVISFFFLLLMWDTDPFFCF